MHNDPATAPRQPADWAIITSGLFGLKDVSYGDYGESAWDLYDLDAVGAACRDDGWLRVHPVTVEWWGGQFASGITNLDSSIISKVRRCHAEVSSSPQTMWATPYGSDLRLMQGIGSVPTVHYGPGDAGLAHGPCEYVSIDELLTATRALTMIAIDHCELS